jgi:hypothetical protein
MNTLYYSNYCKHCQKVIQFFTKNNLTDKANFICIDNRKRDPATGAIVITMPNGSAINLPPNLQSVPAMLVPSRNYQMVMGDDILQLYSSATASIHVGGGGGGNTAAAMHAHVEPSAFSFSAASGGGVFSEQYTSVALSHEDLSAKGNSQRRSLGNYVSADVETIHIYAPEETNARSSKLAESVTVDNLQQKRQQDLENARSSGTVNGNNNAYKPYQPPRQPPIMQQQQQQQPTMGYAQQQQQQPVFRKQPPPIGGGQYAY